MTMVLGTNCHFKRNIPSELSTRWNSKNSLELSYEKGTKKQVNKIKRQSNLERSAHKNNQQMVLKYEKE